MDLSGFDATPAEVGALMDALAEYDEDGGGYGEDQAAADWAASLSDAELDELLAEYEADQHLPGPQLAGAGSENAIDLAAEMSAIDLSWPRRQTARPPGGARTRPSPVGRAARKSG